MYLLALYFVDPICEMIHSDLYFTFLIIFIDASKTEEIADMRYRYAECLLDCLDLSSATSMHVWKMKEKNQHPNFQKAKHKSWSDKVKRVAGGGNNQFLLQ